MRLSKIFKIPLKAVESVLIIGYIIFEEFIWNTFAKPIFEYLKQLALLDTLRETFLNMNRYLLVTIFILIFVLAEYLGVLALILVAEQQILVGGLIYATKIPIASFVFWLFELTKPKLLTFGWLKFSYDRLMKLIDIVVNSSIYLGIKHSVKSVKENLRALFRRFIKENPFFRQLKSWYGILKAKLFKPSSAS